MSARPIGEIIAPIVAEARRLAMYQCLVDCMKSDAARKQLICLWREHGLIDDAQVEMLITANMLEAA